MENNTPSYQTKNNKIVIIIAIVVAILLVGGGIIWAIYQNSQYRQEIKNLKQQIETANQKAEESVSPVENSVSRVTKKSTWSSQITNLKFSYPESWSLTDEKDEDDSTHAVILTKGGKEIRFEESESGFGAGYCDSQETIQFKRHNRIMNGSLSVVEESGEQNRIYVSTNTTLSDGTVKVCDTFTDGAILPTSQTDNRGGIYNSQRKPRISFYYHGDSSKLTTEEKAEVIEILSSLSLK